VNRAQGIWTIPIAIWGGLWLSLPACSRGGVHPQVQEWHKGMSPARLTVPTNMQAQISHGAINQNQMELRQQSISGVPIEGTFLKIVRDHDEPVFARSRAYAEAQLPDPKIVERELHRASFIQLQSALLARDLGCQWRSELKPKLRLGGVWQVLFSRLCESRNGFVYEVTMNSNGTVLSQERMGAGFEWENLPVTLFPRGPRFSQLQEIPLNISALPFYLSTPLLEVVSDAGVKFPDRLQIQESRPGDDRFDMLQAYFYATEALRWVQDNYKFEMGKLKIRTQVGYPEKSNVAFYFAREIRLGTGDDVTYAHLTWDPSVVMHETFHGVIETLTGLPFRGEGGSIQEALADSMAALALDSPRIAESSYKKGEYQRTLENDFKMSDRNGKLYHDSLIVSGTVWQIRKEASAQMAVALVGYLLTHLAPDSQFADLDRHLQGWLNTCSESSLQKCGVSRQVIQSRGWTL